MGVKKLGFEPGKIMKKGENGVLEERERKKERETRMFVLCDQSQEFLSFNYNVV